MKPMPSTAHVVRGAYRRHAVMLACGIGALVLGQLTGMLLPKFSGIALDSVAPMGKRSTDVFSVAATDSIAWMQGWTGWGVIGACLLVMGVFAISAAVFQFGKRYALTGLSRHIEFDLRENLMAKLHTLPMSFFARSRSGDVLSRATSDVDAVRMMVGPAVMYVGEALVMLPVALTAMFAMSPSLTMWALVPLALLTACTLWFSPRTRKYSLESQERLADLSARAQENFSGVRVVKAFGREEFESQEFDKLGGKVLDAQLSLARNRAGFHAAIAVLSGAGMLVFLYFGARKIAAHEITLGQFLEFNLYYIMLYWPMIALGWVIMLVVRGRVSARRINEVLSEPADPISQPGGADAVGITGEVVFENVGFEYEAGKPALTSISFKVSPGKSLAIVGPVGCGKSTAAALLTRLRKPTSGRVLIDGKPIEDYDSLSLRRVMGYVPQETFLFSESIGANISFGAGDIPEAEIEEAADIAQLAPEVEAFPEKYGTLLGERGVNLSGGQKQRTAIARALAKRPKIVVLDDCLSAVDTRTEEAILKGLKRALARTTSVIIAQRVSAVAHCDEILVLEHGRIVERGTDAELRVSGGLYSRLAQRQSLEESLA